MAISNETRHTLKCDNPDCKTELTWKSPLSPANQPPDKLKEFIITEDPNGFKQHWCSDECVITGIEKNLHRTPVVALADENEIAKVGKKVVTIN